MKNNETVLQKLCKDCRQAFLSETPIIYVLTNEIDLINQLVDSDVLTPQYIRIPNEGVEYASKYKKLLKQLYHFLKNERKSCSLKEVAIACQLSLEESEKFLLAYIDEDEKVNRLKFIDNYENHYNNMLPQIINFKYFQYTDGNPNFSIDMMNDMEPMIQVWWNFKETEDTIKRLHKYVNEYENSQTNSIYRQSTLLICSLDYKLYSGLNHYVSVIDVSLPNEWEIENIINQFIAESNGVPIKTKAYLNKIVTAFKGYNGSQVKKLLKGMLIKAKNDLNKYDVIADIQEDKKQMVKKSDILQLIEPKENEVNVGGQESLLHWLKDQKYGLKNPKEQANNFGNDPSKGVLVCGISGTGKSLAAKQAAVLIDLPLLKMDIGSLMDSYIGASEAKMRSALKLAEAMSPCILWLDELEKGFAGAKKGSSSGDSGTFQRMFGTFLVWMQEIDLPVFIYATSNDISEMPAEFWRSGRFDALYGMFMPTRSECIEIFKNTLNKMANTVKNAVEDGEAKTLLFEMNVTDKEFLGECVDLCIKGKRRKFVTGADIYTIVNKAMNIIKKDFLQSDNTICREQLIYALQFKTAIDKALNDVGSFAEGIGKLNSIAQTYITLLADNSFNISGKNALIKTEMFNKDVLAGTLNDDESEKKVIDIDKISKLDNLYDQLLLESIVERINKIGKSRNS